MMSARPSTAATQPRKALLGPSTITASAASRSRPYSAGLPNGDAASTSPTRVATQGVPGGKDKANTSSEELIRDLERKVRKIVEQKRAESDKLRFAVAKKRDEVEKAKLILQDLLKDSEALGLRYNLLQGIENLDGEDDNNAPEEEDPTRLQPIASISRRPVYSKHTKINELESKLERRAKETHTVYLRTLVLEHIKKRLVHERMVISQETNQLKHQFAELNHETQELHKKEIVAGEAVNQIQTRLAQQKDEMAANVRRFRHELALRQKWAREKAKFEKYYNDQLQAIGAKAQAPMTEMSEDTPPRTPQTRGGATSPIGTLRARKSSTLDNHAHEEAMEALCKQAFQRIGVDSRVEAIDPEEIIHICLSHEELRKELDAKHDESVEHIAHLREQIERLRSIAREEIPLSTRGTSQKIETKQLEISSLERQLATVVDQYVFVEETVRPIKMGLQQVLQNISNDTVNMDNMSALEKTLVDSCEEMMRLMRESHPEADSTSPIKAAPSPAPIRSPSIIPEEEADEGSDTKSQESSLPVESENQLGDLTNSSSKDILSIESFTSPFNVRIQPKERGNYYVPGLDAPLARHDAEEDVDDTVFEVMDRAMVKRVSSVLVCTAHGKKSKQKQVQETD
ncbi:hypothetical protein Poli38472_009184 [Pythium oligandrum]|uniref:Uncharacterized protein n=1 Tax=Pythium oligandrum TaxID=41045 RepID=A0A8K1CK99_PYTOL|nr:hypothetical protein Poli38472_009184 [Pythium oligandrum]|eukprot:TMW65017.1 hypothetical protein Poli38472_009184 [Pythium oligandrum]